MQMQTIGDEQHPIRASSLPALFKCPRLFIEKVMVEGDQLGDEKAQTGNLVHAGIKAFHDYKGKGDALTHAKALMQLAAKVYTAGDYAEAERMLEAYARRELSERRGKVILCEEKITLTLAASPLDPTGNNIYITGTVDLVRLLGKDVLYIIDHKTGMTYGENMVKGYMAQLAAYGLAIMQRYPDKKYKTFITRIQDLKRSNLPFWWPMPGLETPEGCMKVLEVVVDRIAILRAGRIHHTSSKECETYCPLVMYPNCQNVELGVKPKLEQKPEVVKQQPKAMPLTVKDLFS